MLYNPEWQQTKTKAEIMIGAANLIRKHGLVKQHRGSVLEGFCIHGAVSMAATGNAFDDDTSEPVMRDVVSYMKSQGIDNMPGWRTGSDWCAGPWNNMPERTKEEVIAVLEGAAAHAV